MKKLIITLIFIFTTKLLFAINIDNYKYINVGGMRLLMVSNKNRCDIYWSLTDFVSVNIPCAEVFDKIKEYKEQQDDGDLR